MKKNLNTLLLKLDALMSSNHLAEAVSLCEEYLGIFPDEILLHQKAAKLYSMNGNMQSLVASYEKIAELSSAPDLLFSVAKGLDQIDAQEKSINIYRKILNLVPDNSTITNNLAIALNASKQHAEAEKLFNKLIAKHPDNQHVIYNFACMLMQNENYDAALSHLKELAKSGHELELVYRNLIDIYIRHHDFSAALKFIDLALKLTPHDVKSLAMKLIALDGLNRQEEFDFLISTEKHIKEFTLNFAEHNLIELNQEIIKYALCHGTMGYIPKGSKIKYGNRSGSLLTHGWSDNKFMVTLVNGLNAAFLEYIKFITDDNSHPLRSNFLAKYELRLWAVDLTTNAHLDPHIHAKSWISGVYYAEIPDFIGSDDNVKKEGLIEFNNFPEEYKLKPSKNIKYLTPKTGNAILFPSYAWHSTIPITRNFEGKRVSFPFDFVQTT